MPAKEDVTNRPFPIRNLPKEPLPDVLDHEHNPFQDNKANETALNLLIVIPSTPSIPNILNLANLVKPPPSQLKKAKTP